MIDCILQLYDVSGVKFGDFTLKSGIKSPFYFDLRVVVSYPRLMEMVADIMWATRPKDAEFDCICGVPYTALPLASVIAVKQNIPMVVRRKEAKSYGTKKMIEGVYRKGQRCLIIEDVIVSGSSVYETAEVLRQNGLVVSDALVFIDRQQSGTENLRELGINIVSSLDVEVLMGILLEAGKVSSSTVDSVRLFVKSHRDVVIATPKTNGVTATCQPQMSFSSRIDQCPHPLTKKLLGLMEKKQTNLCVAADVTLSAQLISLAETLGPYICLLKTHIDILTDFTPELTKELKQIANKHNFLIFEDRKFGDIGNTVIRQYSGGMYNIMEWADLVTVHSVPGEGQVKALAESLNGQVRGCVLVAQMSTHNTLTTKEYSTATVRIAEAHPYIVMGFISQSCLTADPRFLHMTPGVSLSVEGRLHDQNYVTPASAVLRRGADIVIVGRGVTQAEDPVKTVQEYQRQAFEAYQQRIGK